MTKLSCIIYFVLAPFLCFFLLSCRSAIDHTTTAIEGTLSNKSQQHQYVYVYAYPDSFSILHFGKKLLDSCRVDGQGRFQLELNHWGKSGFVDLATTSEPLMRDVFLVPGRHLTLDFDCLHTPAILSNRNQLDNYNRFLQEFSDTFYRSAAVKEEYYNKSNFLLVPEYAKYIDLRHQQELDFAGPVLADPAIEKSFKLFLQNEIDYQWANDKIAFLWKKWVRNEELLIDETYYNFLQALKIDNPEALHSPAYSRFLQLYIREMHRQLPVNQQAAGKQPYVKCDIAQKLTSGNALKIALLHILNNELDNAISLGQMDQKKMVDVRELAEYMANITGDHQYIEIVQTRKPE